MFYLVSAQKAEKAVLVFFHLYQSETESEKCIYTGSPKCYLSIKTINTPYTTKATVFSCLKIIGLTYTFCTEEKISAYLNSFLFRLKIKLSWIEAISFKKIYYSFWNILLFYMLVCWKRMCQRQTRCNPSACALPSPLQKLSFQDYLVLQLCQPTAERKLSVTVSIHVFWIQWTITSLFKKKNQNKFCYCLEKN